MIDIENRKKLIEISLQAKAYADVHKYASEVTECDPGDSYAWAAKGIAAANSFDASRGKPNEALVFLNTALQIGLAQDIKKLASNHLINAFEAGINEINKSLKSRIVDYQKVSMPEGGSTLIHAFGQSVHKITVAKEFAPLIVEYTNLLPLIFRLQPSYEVASKISKYFSDIELHSKDLGEYLKDSDPGRVFYKSKEEFSVFLQELIPDFVNSTAQIKKSEGCFIATAAAGSYDHPTVYDLRKFRDEVLSTNSMGRSFIKFYYKHSPIIAKVISNRKILRNIVFWGFVKPASCIARLINSLWNRSHIGY